MHSLRCALLTRELMWHTHPPLTLYPPLLTFWSRQTTYVLLHLQPSPPSLSFQRVQVVESVRVSRPKDVASMSVPGVQLFMRSLMQMATGVWTPAVLRRFILSTADTTPSLLVSIIETFTISAFQRCIFFKFSLSWSKMRSRQRLSGPGRFQGNLVKALKP